MDAHTTAGREAGATRAWRPALQLNAVVWGWYERKEIAIWNDWRGADREGSRGDACVPAAGGGDCLDCRYRPQGCGGVGGAVRHSQSGVVGRRSDRRQECGCGADLLADGHARGPDCAGGEGGEADFLREADRVQPGQDRHGAGRGGEGRREAADRIQPAVRLELRCACARRS